MMKDLYGNGLEVNSPRMMKDMYGNGLEVDSPRMMDIYGNWL